MSQPLPIAKNNEHELFLLPQMANRHGLITGATGTGKTVTLQTLAEAFSRIGVPVFLSDIKGDLSGLGKAGGSNARIGARIKQLQLDYFEHQAYPVTFWDVFGKMGHPLRATISDMGPLLLGRMLNLNEVQQGVLALVFKIADDCGLLLLDLKDLRAMVQSVGDNAADFTTEYGNISTASIGAIQRGLLQIETQGGDKLFGEPMLNIEDLMQTDANGCGMINILAADQLMTSPKVYSAMLLWLLAELFENLPEAGDLAKPRMVFFFDEAHLLFNDAPVALLDKVEQVVRLIRSKGVGIYFVTQNPGDVPDKVLGQLGNRVQHALRAFSPRDQKAVKAAAETMRDNPELDEVAAITELGVGEALVSCLDENGIPGIVERAFILPPQGQIGPLTDTERKTIMQNSLLAGYYEKAIDRESAYEILKGRTDEKQPASQPQNPVQQPNRHGASATPNHESACASRFPHPILPPVGEGENESLRESHVNSGGGIGSMLGGIFGNNGPGSRVSNRQGIGETLMKSAVRSIGSAVGREIIRGVLGSILGKSR